MSENVNIKVGDVEATVAAIGVGAKVIYNNVERALTQVEAAEQALDIERSRLAEAVTAYVQRLQTQAEAAQTISHQGSPYKALLEYDISDAALFYGRSSALGTMMDRAHTAPFTALHAESGAGKTSLVKAGLMPRLLAEGQVPLYVRPYRTPVHFAIKRVLVPQLEQSPNLAISSLHDFLRHVTDLLGGSPLVIFLDQFEEIFTVQQAPARAEFIDELAACLADDLLPVRWVLSMRTEWFGQLGTFRPQVRNPFASEYLLRALTPTEAREIITEPAQARGVTYEEGLVERILQDLGGEGIQPPQLQLVCAALYDMLPRQQRQITAALYKQAGEAKGILRGHLSRVLSQQVSEHDEPAARLVIEALVTSDGRRALRTRDDLCTELALQSIEEGTVDSILDTLTTARLLRTADLTEGGSAYELAHDYLLDRIEIDEGAVARKAARELLTREMESYKQHGTLLSPEELTIIERYKGEIPITPEERTLIEQSEKRLARQRRRVYLGVGGVAALVLVAIAAVIAALSAGQQVSAARQTQQAIALTVQQAERDAQSAEEAAATAQGAQQQAGAQLQTAEAAQAEAEAASENARSQLGTARQELVAIYEETGVIAVADGPIAMAFDGQRPWTLGANDDRVQVLDTEVGAVAWEVSVGTRPVALAWDGARMWVANRGDNTLQIIDPETRTASEPIPVRARPVALEYVPESNTMWVAADRENSVQQLDADTGEVLTSIPVGAAPGALEWDGRYMWVANTDDDTIQQIDPELNAVTLTVAELNDEPRDILWDEANGVLWVANYGDNTLQKVAPDTGELLATVDVGIRPIALTTDGVNVWVANENDSSITQLDPVTNEVLQTRQLPAGPFGLVWDGFSLWVSIADSNRVYRLEPENTAVVQALPVGDRPSPILYDEGLNGLWVANVQDDTLMFVSPSTGAIISTISVGQNPAHLLRAGPYVWVSAKGANAVQLVSATGRFVQFDVPVGFSPDDLAYDGETVWVAIEGDSRLQRIDPSAAAVSEAVVVEGDPTALLWIAERGELWVGSAGTDTVQAYDPAAGEFGISVEVGTAPADMAWDGQTLWVTSDSVNELVGIDPATGEVVLETITPDEPNALLWDGERLWVLGSRNGSLAQVDRTTGRLMAAVPVRTASQAFTTDGTSLWVTNLFGDTIQQINVRAINAIVDARLLVE
jgi:YVTN family beta-propeller protein